MRTQHGNKELCDLYPSLSIVTAVKSSQSSRLDM